jgi:hypothetical protein
MTCTSLRGQRGYAARGWLTNYANYAAWRRLSSAIGTVDDLRFLKHELEELRALREGGLTDPSGLKVPADEVRGWQDNFLDNLYFPAHLKALEAELEFIRDEIKMYTRGSVDLSMEEIAMSDPLRSEARTFARRDGLPIMEHPRSRTWNRSLEMTTLSPEVAKSLGLSERCCIADVIRAVKLKAIRSSR